MIPPPTPLAAAGSPGASPEGSAEGRVPVLFVDDHEHVGIMMNRWLRNAPDLHFAGWIPTPSRLEYRLSAGQDSASRRTVVVLDYSIPGVEVRELISQLRRTHPWLRIVVFTAYPEHEEEVLAAGADRCVAKDAGAAALIEAIRSSSARP